MDREQILAWMEYFCIFPRLMDYDVFKEISLKPKTRVKPAIFLSFDKKWDSDENILSSRVI